MANAVFGWINNVNTGSISTSTPPSAGLGTDLLKDDQGSASKGLQCPVTTLAIRIDGTSTTKWRAFLLARTNISPTATVSFQVGPKSNFLAAPASVNTSFINISAAGLTAAGWTHTRASVGTIMNDAGTLITDVAANLPRSNGSGILLENAATNRFGTNASSTTGQTAGTGNTLTDTGFSLHATTKETGCTYGGGADTNIWTMGVTGLTSGTIYCGSIYVYVPGPWSGTALTLAWEGNQANAVSGAVDLSKRDQFQRVYCYAIINAASSNVVLRETGATTGDILYVTCRQAETGRTPTSYIVTSTVAVTRNFDTLVNSSAALTAALVAGNYTIYLQHRLLLIPPITSSAIADFYMQTAGGVSCMVMRSLPAPQNFAYNTAGTSVASIGYLLDTNTIQRNCSGVSTGTLTLDASSNTGAVITRTGLAAANIPTKFGAAWSGEVSIYLTQFSAYNTKLSTAQITALAKTGSSLTSNLVYNASVAGPAAGYGQVVNVAPAEVVGESCQITITDTANTDGFLNIPLAFAGPVFQPLTNIAYDTTFGRSDNTDEVSSRGGSEFPSVQWVKRRWEVKHQGLRASEVWPQIMELDRIARTGTNVLFVPDYASSDVAKEAVFGRLKSTSDVGFPFGNGDRRSWSATISERL